MIYLMMRVENIVCYFTMENENTLINLLEYLKSKEFDLILLNCILLDIEKQKAVYHLPGWIKNRVIKKFPKYLFRQNVIGPTSTLVIKRKIYSKFDEKLKWLLDVDAYYASLVNAKKVLFLKNMSIVSITNKTDTLTSELGTNIKIIEQQERKYLFKKYKNIIWNKNNLTYVEKLFFCLENLIWKVVIKIFMSFKINKYCLDLIRKIK